MKKSRNTVISTENTLREEVIKLLPLELQITAPEQVECILNDRPGIMDVVRAHNMWDKDASHILAHAFSGEGFWISRSDKIAFKIWEKLALSGECEAQMYIWAMYFLWRWIEENYGNAFKWLTKSSEHWNSSAQCLLWIMYRDWMWVEKDYEKALELFTKSAVQGYAQAMFHLYGIFSHKKSFQQAGHWLGMAASNGSTGAKAILLGWLGESF